MTGDTNKDRHLARQSRLVAIVIAGATLLWLVLQWVGGALGWPARFAFLIDMAALAAFVWAFVVTWRLWRARQGDME